MIRVVWTTVAVVVCLLVAPALSFAQIAVGDPVPLCATAVEQGTTEVGDPANGDYSILVNGHIEAYACVSVYDNWISFGLMDPTTGTYASPYRRWAFSQTGEGTYASGGWDQGIGVEDGGQDPLYAVNGSTLNFDLAGFQIQTNARLDLDIDMGGLMTKVDENGDPWGGR